MHVARLRAEKMTVQKPTGAASRTICAREKEKMYHEISLEVLACAAPLEAAHIFCTQRLRVFSHNVSLKENGSLQHLQYAVG